MNRSTLLRYSLAVFGSAVLSFGLCHIHSHSGITEGGILGLTLFLQYWLHLSPALSSLLLNFACYGLGWKLLGRDFIKLSAVSAVSYSLFYRIFEQIPPLFPQLSQQPLLSAILGAVFVGIGAGLPVRAGGAPGGDDALAMSVTHLTHIKIQWAYLASDLIVLALSLTYIPLTKLLYSLLTVILSGQIVGLVQKIPLPDDK